MDFLETEYVFVRILLLSPFQVFYFFFLVIWLGYELENIYIVLGISGIYELRGLCCEINILFETDVNSRKNIFSYLRQTLQAFMVFN